ncbi:hypothetical protein AB0O22_38755, partial [Streptomyces sp. NPDC091204]
MTIIYIAMLPIIGRLMDKAVRNICPGCATEKSWWIEAFNSLGQPAIAMALFLLVLRSANSFLRAFNLMTGAFLSLDVWAATIHECAEIVRAPRVRDQHYTGIVWRSVLCTLDARAMRGTTGVSSWRRRKTMRRHAYRVADALREAEARLDVDPKESARTTARILLKVSTRYAEGRLGALLDEEDLSSVPVQPHRFKAVRLLVTVVSIAAIAIVGPTMELSVQVTAAASVMVVAVAYRNAVPRVPGSVPGEVVGPFRWGSGFTERTPLRPPPAPRGRGTRHPPGSGRRPVVSWGCSCGAGGVLCWGLSVWLRLCEWGRVG